MHSKLLNQMYSVYGIYYLIQRVPTIFINLQAKKALKNILTKCVYLPALEPLLHDAPPSILRHVVGQFSKVLVHNII